MITTIPRPCWAYWDLFKRVVLIGLGSNRGDSKRIVREAMEAVAVFARGSVRRSHLWLTSPVDCPPEAADFINAAVAFEPREGLSPEELLSELKAIEAVYGRQRSQVRNAPRELDLDLLLFGAEHRHTATFTLPHPRAVNRRFVLAPAAEVAPELIWPGTGKSIRELLTGLHSDEVVRKILDTPA